MPGHPQFHIARLLGDHVDRVDAPGVPEPLGSRSQIGGLRPRGQTQRYPETGRRAPHPEDLRRDRLYLAASDPTRHERPQAGGCTVSPHTSNIFRYERANRPQAIGRPTVAQYTRGALYLAYVTPPAPAKAHVERLPGSTRT
jgi:hypothetical protein